MKEKLGAVGNVVGMKMRKHCGKETDREDGCGGPNGLVENLMAKNPTGSSSYYLSGST
jgi:hypothetical protein